MKSYTIYIDENLPEQLADGLDILVKPYSKKAGIEISISSINKRFRRGITDEEWIPIVGQENGIVITQDNRIHSTKHQRELYIQNGVGILFMQPPSKNGWTYWDIVKRIVEQWEDIAQIIKRNKTPFAYRCTSNKKFEKI